MSLLALVVWWRLGVLSGLGVLIVGIVAQVAYVRWFRHVSGWMGYGSVADTPADAAMVPTGPTRVTFYTASACPFCPIVRRRLADLQRQGQLEVEEIEVTFRPDVVRAKGIRSVPVLESGGRFLVGNATSAQIAAFLGDVRTTG
ncbi:MAG: hypothetical protein KJ061_17565 [Vicinamibacteraceae bacterium]|nr:hypothetical protein [Vicinamibacteraceae bacterium]